MGLSSLIGNMQKLIDDTREAVKERDEQQWEYAVYEWIVPGDILLGNLNAMGKERWELIVESNGFWVFKRPKLEDNND